MTGDPSFPYGRNYPKPPPANVSPADLNSDEERARLTDLSIGYGGKPCAHELHGVPRVRRTGLTPQRLQDLLSMSPHKLQEEFQRGLCQEEAAHRAGIPIHDARVPPGTK